MSGVGFEPTLPFRESRLKSDALDRSANLTTPPKKCHRKDWYSDM